MAKDKIRPYFFEDIPAMSRDVLVFCVVFYFSEKSEILLNIVPVYDMINIHGGD